MAARDSMAYLVGLLRTKVNDEASSVWTDDELQRYLDMYSVPVRRKRLENDPDELIYYAHVGLLEGTYSLSSEDGATWDDDNTIIKMWDSSAGGATAITPDNWNLVNGAFWFDEDQNNTYYLDAISYNIAGAVAECLEQLAIDPTKAMTWMRGGVSFTAYDLMAMAKYHRSLTGPRSTTVRKTYRTR